VKKLSSLLLPVMVAHPWWLHGVFPVSMFPTLRKENTNPTTDWSILLQTVTKIEIGK
jgi:hypothetical protein